MTMPLQDAEALAELARLCSEARAGLPETGFHRLRVLLDMILVDLAREGFGAQAGTGPASDRQTAKQTDLPQKSP
jgi:hypothetical protein